MNKITIFGRLGADPELKATQNGTSVCTFSVATNKKWKNQQGGQEEETQWHRIVAWKNLADICAKYLFRGRQVIVEGELKYRKYTDKQNIERNVSEITAREIHFVGASQQNQDQDKAGSEWDLENSGGTTQQPQQQPTQQPQQQPTQQLQQPTQQPQQPTQPQQPQQPQAPQTGGYPEDPPF